MNYSIFYLKFKLNCRHEISSGFRHEIPQSIEIFFVTGIKNIVDSEIDVHIF